MSAPPEGQAFSDGPGAPQQHGLDPRSNGLPRRRTDEHDALSANSLAPHGRTEASPRSSTDPEQQQVAAKPKKTGKICGKCGEGLTGQFVRALGDTFHLECFTCHVSRKLSLVSALLLGGRDAVSTCDAATL
jgi:hypothetical protein